MIKSRIGHEVIELDLVDVIEYRVGTGPDLAGFNLKPHQAEGSGQAQLSGSEFSKHIALKNLIWLAIGNRALPGLLENQA